MYFSELSDDTLRKIISDAQKELNRRGCKTNHTIKMKVLDSLKDIDFRDFQEFGFPGFNLEQLKLLHSEVATEIKNYSYTTPICDYEILILRFRRLDFTDFPLDILEKILSVLNREINHAESRKCIEDILSENDVAERTVIVSCLVAQDQRKRFLSIMKSNSIYYELEFDDTITNKAKTTLVFETVQQAKIFIKKYHQECCDDENAVNARIEKSCFPIFWNA